MSETALTTSATITDAVLTPSVISPSTVNNISPKETNSTSAMSKWQIWIWGACVAMLCLELLTLTVMAYIRTNEIAHVVSNSKINEAAFVLAGLSMSSFSLIRILAILIGSGIIFGGLSISFFSSERANKIDVETKNAINPVTANIVSNSPGVIGILMGGAIIICALFAKTTFTYEQPVTLSYDNQKNTSSPPAPQKPALSPEAIKDLINKGAK